MFKKVRELSETFRAHTLSKAHFGKNSGKRTKPPTEFRLNSKP